MATAAAGFNDWQKVRDENGNIYWWNVNTDETRWDTPPGLSSSSAASTAPKAATAPTSGNGSRPNSPKTGSKKHRKGGGKPAHAAGGPLVSEATPPPSHKPKRSITFFGHKDKGKPKSGATGEIATKIKQLRKEKGADADLREVMDSIEIGQPYDVEHKLQVVFDPNQVKFKGLPSEWSDEANKHFGVPLQQCPRIPVEGFKSRIPAVLVMLRHRLEELNGVEAEGLFRIAPDGNDSNEVKRMINSGAGMQALADCNDPHVMANLIKQFFRHLQPNLLNCVSRDKIMELAEVRGAEACSVAIHQLPEPHQSVFLWLLDTLAMVAANKDVNRMTTKNLAIVLAPNLFDPGDGTSPMEAMVMSQKCATLVSNFLDWRMGA